MSNVTVNQMLADQVAGRDPIIFDLPVKGSTHIYANVLVSQHSGGYLVHSNTSGAGPAVGMSEHEQNNTSATDGAARCRIRTKCIVALANGLTTDAFAETSIIGSLVFALDDHTVADNSGASFANEPIGFFYGMQSDGKVRVYLDPAGARLVNLLQTAFTALTDTPATADALRDDIVAVFGAAFG
jgi:hypothetical protein